MRKFVLTNCSGNRTGTEAGGDGNGLNLREGGYTANLLNQYESRGILSLCG